MSEVPQVPEVPEVVVFDVNETLSDLAPMAERFADVGLPREAVDTWFAAVLRDGMGLSLAGEPGTFADVAAGVLRSMHLAAAAPGDPDAAAQHVVEGFLDLPVHPDVDPGTRALADLGVRLVTLSNGSASVAERLLERAGLRDRFEQVLSVDDAGAWKPAPVAYRYALGRCVVEPDRAMLVAVHPWDTDGARRAGLQAAHLDRGGSGFPPHLLPPTVQVRSLPELATLWGPVG
jgi:2-haloacid dehalogenase